MGVDLPAHTGFAELADRAGPRSRDDDPVEAAAAISGGFEPPFFELRILKRRSVRLVAQAGGDAVETVFLPHIHNLRPAAGGADDAPHTEAELIALFLSDRAPVRGHVMAVVGPIGTDDVDEFVRVDLVVHQRSSDPRAPWPGPCPHRRTRTPCRARRRGDATH